MENEKVFALLEELFQTDSLHEEYSINEKTYVIDAKKNQDGNKVIITVSLKKEDNKEKKEFEAWVDTLPDDFFYDVWESLSNEYSTKELSNEYASGDYKKVIKLFKDRANEIVNSRIEELTKLLVVK